MAGKAKISISLAFYKPGRFFNVSLKNEIRQDRYVSRQPASVMVLANVRGDFVKFARFLIKNRVIDNQLKWCFEKGHLVIIGDVLDDMYNGAECLWLLYSLEEQAHLAGGCVHYVPGNLDRLAVSSIWQRFHPNYAMKLEESENRLLSTALYGGNTELSSWVGSKRAPKRIGTYLYTSQWDFERMILTGENLTDLVNDLRRQLQVPVHSKTKAEEVAVDEYFVDDSVSVVEVAGAHIGINPDLTEAISSAGCRGIISVNGNDIVVYQLLRKGGLRWVEAARTGANCLLFRKDVIYSLRERMERIAML